MSSAAVMAAACIALTPLVTAAFAPGAVKRWSRGLSVGVQVVAPCLLCVPYVLVARSFGNFEWRWLWTYLLLPVAVAGLLRDARRRDAGQRGDWRDYVVLATLGLAVDLRWFQGAWPHGLSVFNKVLLLDAGIWGLLVVRRLEGVGFDLRLRWRDLRVGAREFLFYAPMAVVLGLGMEFLHVHAGWPGLLRLAGMFLFTFFFIAVPEELFFRGWLQNLLERRIGRNRALLLTAVLFGLAHFNKLARQFNWRYVVLAALAGVFYGRAWREDRRVGASAITHACVDTVWSVWLH